MKRPYNIALLGDETLDETTGPRKPNRLLQLDVELQCVIMEFLPLDALHPYCNLLFTVYRTRSLHWDKWRPNQLYLLHSAAHCLLLRNTLEWGGWLRAQMRAAEMEISQYTRSEGNRACTLRQIEAGKAILGNEHYEVIKFVTTPLCTCCKARGGTDYAQGVARPLLLCEVCRDAMNVRKYAKAKELPETRNPYSWISTQLARNLLRMPRSANIADYAQHQKWRSYSGNYGRGAKTEFYLLADVLHSLANK